MEYLKHWIPKFLALDLCSGFCVATEWEVVCLEGTTLAEVILVKGHELPTIVKVLPVVQEAAAPRAMILADSPVLTFIDLDAPSSIQSSSVSSDFTRKILNLENPSLAENEIASLLETSASHVTSILEIISGFTITTRLPTPFFNPVLQQQTPTIPTPTFTTTISMNPTVTLPEIPNFASIFKFYQRVSALESKMSELKQTNQFAEAVSSIPGIVDKYLASKMKEPVNVVVQLQTNKLREEAQAENQEFLNQVDSTMKKIIKDQVKD
uniref:Reverse transcriptase domain-containing protein n=1 Tax=Tanacetum cinerariifolium TaxID=118510 RepID=A0A6L2NPG4_TANCI|nr:hypothetical protein [Tanacetum cinerariifolium]